MNRYIVKANRIKFIEKNFFQWSFDKPDDYVPNKEAFNRLNHPAELHYLASIYNWDDGPIVLEWIIDSPLCTKATANLIFWRAQPDFYTGFELNAINPKDGYDEDYDMLRILRKIIEKNQKNDFSPFNIEFDPYNELEDLKEKSPKWAVPKALYEKIEGVKVIVVKRGIDVSQRTIIITIIVILGLLQIWKLIAP